MIKGRKSRGFTQSHFLSPTVNFYNRIKIFFDLLRVKNEKKSGAGFTLIEMILVLFFACILIVVLYNLYDWHSKVYNYQQSLVRVSTASRGIISTMQTYTSQANRILSSASVNGSNYTTSADTLVLQLPAIDSSSNIVSGKWDKAAFYPSGSNFYLQFEPDPASSRSKLNKLLSDSLTSISITYNTATATSASVVTVNVKNQLTVKNQSVTSSLLQDMHLNNY